MEMSLFQASKPESTTLSMVNEASKDIEDDSTL